MSLTVVLGPGRAGCALALAERRAGQEVLLVGRRAGAWQRWAKRHGVASRTSLEGELPEADRALVAVPDGELRAAAQALEERLAFRRRGLAAHLSGLHDLRPLRAWARRGVRIAAVHPVVSFGAAESAAAALRDASVTVLAGEGARNAVRTMVQGWGSRCLWIPQDVDRRRYHLALALASNHVTAILAWAAELLEPALGRKAAGVVADLAQQSVRSFHELGAARALTGPVVRGDHEVVQQHLRALRGGERERYRGLLEPVLALAEESGRLSPAQARELRRLLDS